MSKRIIITTLIASFIFMITMIVMLMFETFEDDRSLIRMQMLNILSKLGAIATSIHLCYLIHNYGFDWATL